MYTTNVGTYAEVTDLSNVTTLLVRSGAAEDLRWVDSLWVLKLRRQGRVP